MLDHQALVCSAYQLQPLPPSVARLAVLMGQAMPDFREIVEVVSFDPALTIKLLRLANSAASSPRSTVASVKEAVLRLGTGAVFSLAIGSCAQPLLRQAIPGYALSGGSLWRHSVAAALAAEVAGSFCQEAGTPLSFTAALLHDFGKLVLGPFLTPEMCVALKQATAEGLEAYQAEAEVLSVHHGEVGGVIAQHWQLPERIVYAIIHHHAPEAVEDTVCYVTQLADAAAHCVAGESNANDFGLRSLSLTWERLGINAQGFDALCETVAHRLDEVVHRYD